MRSLDMASFVRTAAFQADVADARIVAAAKTTAKTTTTKTV